MPTLTLTISEEDKSLIQAAAATAGMPVGKYVVSLLGQAPRFLDEEVDDLAEAKDELNRVFSRQMFINYAQNHMGVQAFCASAVGNGRNIESVFPLTGDAEGYYILTSGTK